VGGTSKAERYEAIDLPLTWDDRQHDTKRLIVEVVIVLEEIRRVRAASQHQEVAESVG
jgi:hypothetical protein